MTINDEILIEGQEEIKEYWKQLKDSLEVEYEEDDEIEMCSERTVEVILNEQVPGELYLRQFNDRKVVAFTFEDSDVWVDVETFEVDYPANWEYPEEFKIEIKG